MTLLAWRRFPLGVFAVTALSSALLAGLGYPVDLALGPTAALYLLAASRERESPWTPKLIAVVVGLFVAYLGAAAGARAGFPGVELLHTGLAWSVAWFAGERTRLRREHLDDLRHRALRAERDAEREHLLATARERARIARDLHDSAGHAISLIAVRAGAARLRHRQDPDNSLPALTAIEELARHTAGEIDQIVATLRDTPDDAAATPTGLASLDTLIAHHTATGLVVDLDTRGRTRTLAATADQAAYRILQESLTNAARHGTGSVHVALSFRDAAVDLVVTNPVADATAPRRGGGHGLVGMRERATLVGGNIHIEQNGDTFQVRVLIPDNGRRT